MASARSRRSSQGGSRSQSPAPSAADVCIKVACRVRPSSALSAVTVDGDSIRLQNPGYVAEQLDSFTFDHAFDQQSTQDEIYRKVCMPVVQGVLSGINGTVFCYGQTGSGKTYTMEGIEKDPGLLPRLGNSIFDSAHVVPEQVSVCFVEIYMERLQDLLEPSNKVEVRETMSGSVYLAGACERIVSSSAEMLSCVKAGQRNRSVAATKMNERSSRSHSVFSVSVKSCDDISGLPLQGALHFVDLAGSESQGRTGSAGQTLEQSKYINQSLLGLGRVIGALGSGQPHVPYRDSKLTRILQDSLGGTARTSIIVNISPEAVNAYETISSLRFGQGASLVKNAPRVNLVDLSVSDFRKLLSERDAEIARLRARVAAIEGSPSPQKGAKWMTMSTPPRGPRCPEPDFWAEARTVQESQSKRSWTWKRCLMGVVLVVAAFLTNPGKSEARFREFLQVQQTFPVVHRVLEKCWLLQIGVWNLGLAGVGQEGGRYFVGAFGQWIELPGQIPSIGWCEHRDVDAIFFTFLTMFMCWQVVPLMMARHCASSCANFRAGRLWTLATALVSHSQVETLIINTLFLYSAGPQVHAVLGRRRFFALCLFGGLCTTAGSLMLRPFVYRDGPAVVCLGACGPLSALLCYSHAIGRCSARMHWLGRDWAWEEFAAMQLLVGAVAGLDVLSYLLGGAVGWATAEWHLLDLVPKEGAWLAVWPTVDLHILNLVPAG